jgi:hypothetical protein
MNRVNVMDRLGRDVRTNEAVPYYTDIMTTYLLALKVMSHHLWGG